MRYKGRQYGLTYYTDYMASANLYDGLANVDPKGNLVPELASSWDVSPDASSVTFHLRPDAKFQDGSSVEADDVVEDGEAVGGAGAGGTGLDTGLAPPRVKTYAAVAAASTKPLEIGYSAVQRETATELNRATTRHITG